MACSISQTTAHRFITEHLSLTSYGSRFVQKFDEEDFQDQVEICKTLILMLETRKFIVFR